MTDEFSTLVNYTLDYIGYSKENISLRSSMSKTVVRICNQNCTDNTGLELISAGSKTEGVSQLCASDLDFMMVFRDFICVDHGHSEAGIYIIQRYLDECPPGYIKLRPLYTEVERLSPLNLISVYIPNKDIFLLSSIYFRKFLTLMYDNISPIMGLETQSSAISGPALALALNRSMMGGIFSADLYGDFVPAIPYYSSTILDRWKERTRLYDWPSSEVIEEVSTTEGYVVPVGHKYSEEQNFEWRVCFTTGEQRLINSLNEVQIKVYVLLKMINSCLIKDNVDCLSSYMIKNIVMWVAERSSTDTFSPHNLTRMVLQSLAFLRNCLRYSNFLPNYMIADRNLLFGKIDRQEKVKLDSIVTELLNDGETIFLRCEKLRSGMFIMYGNPALAVRISNWRNEVEQLLLLMSVKIFTKIRPDMLFQPNLLYDLFFQYWKDESFVSTAARLLKVLPLNIEKILSNGFQSLEDIDIWMNNIFS